MSSGFLLINKPTGPTSHDIIDELRKITDIKKIGHAGTLDPFASGLLIVGVGRESTKQLDKFLKLNKEYLAELHLGAQSDTYDWTGKVSINVKESDLKQAEIEKALEKFRGEIEQVPPMFSAKKVQGKKLYELARKGEEIVRQPSKVNVYHLEIIEYEWPTLKVKCKVSSGTYVRSLAHDIGQELGVGAYLQELQRISIGPYKLTVAIDLSELNQENWQHYTKNL